MVGRLGNRNSRAALRRTRFPNQPQQEGHFRQTSGPGRDLRCRDGRTLQDLQTFRDKAIAAITVHLHIRDERAFVTKGPLTY
jgi:hypothetical protein